MTMAKAGKKSVLFPTDEELGKRDDDHKPSAASQWLPRTVPKLRKRRLLGALVALLVVYIFVKNLPTDLGPAQTRYADKMGRMYAPPKGARPYPAAQLRPGSNTPLAAGAGAGTGAASKAGPRGAAPPVQGSESIIDQTTHAFDGPIKFYYLASSLHGVARTAGHRDNNKNVVFAASSLKSAAAIIPLACEMSRWKRNYVHMILMGRDEIPLEDVQTINGIDKASCDIFWHDARPDYAIYSSDHRMETSVSGALKHIHNFVHPQALITAGSLHEDAFFTRAMHHKTKELKQTLIQIPQEKTELLSWLTRLDSSSLHAWHTATIDLLVQAPSETSGSVIRLLKSLVAADYDAFEPPRLTVELPARLNDATARYLDGFEWPPARFESHLRNSQLVLRRRIPEKRVDPEHASTRFIESFYPADDEHSHVLVLSPQAQLSPIFFHTLKYYLLEYKYSDSAWMFGTNIFGISLESPSVHLNGTTAFQPPVVPEEPEDGQPSNGMSMYLWQAPNSNAALYFADKWIELHSFLTQHLTAVRHPTTRAHHMARSKLISSKNPSWTEHFLDLMRTRGYYMLYPSLPVRPTEGSDSPATPADSLVIVHNELYTPPEEFSTETSPPLRTSSNADADLTPDTVLDAPAEYLSSHLKSDGQAKGLNNESPLLKNLRAFMPEAPPDDNEDDDAVDPVASDQGPKPLPMVYALPLLDYKGDDITHDDMLDLAQTIAADYRRDAGGCPKDQDRYVPRIPGTHNADDLFCVTDTDLPAYDDESDTLSPPPTPQEPAALVNGNGHLAAADPHVEDDKPFYGAQHHPTGAAAHVNAATDAKGYQATAVAGFNAKLAANEAAHAGDTTPSPEEALAALPLTPAELAELESWERAKAKGVGDKPPPNAKGAAEMDDLEDRTDPGAGTAARGGRVGRLTGWDQGGIDEAAPRAEKAAALLAAELDAAEDGDGDGEQDAEGEKISIVDPDERDYARASHQPAPAVPLAGADAEAELDAQTEPPPAAARVAPVGGPGGRLGRVKGWDQGGIDEAAPDEAAGVQRARTKLELDKIVAGRARVGVDTSAKADAEAEEALSEVDRELARHFGEGKGKAQATEAEVDVALEGEEPVDRGI